PGARIAAPGGRGVAAAAAVARTQAATATPATGMHALDQLLATRVQPVGAADLLRFQAAALGLCLAVVAEVVVGLEFVRQLAHRQCDHDRVVEEAQYLHVVGDHVVRIAEVGQSAEHAVAVLARQCPGLVARHGDEVVQAQQALHDEVGDGALLGVDRQFGRAVDDLFRRLARRRLLCRFHFGVEVLEVAFVEFEVQRDRHGRAGSEGSEKSKPSKPCPARGSCRYAPRRSTTASVSRDTQARRPRSSSMRISHTWVLRPTCNGRAVPVTLPSRTPARWLALISMPTTPWPAPTHRPPAVLPRVSASSTDAPPCSRPYGWRVRSSTGMVART